MIAALTEHQIRRYARHLVLGAVGMPGQKRLLSATLRVDLDGPAAHVALAYLAAAGVGTLAIGRATGSIGADEIAGAPLLVSADIGRPRLAALGERVAALNPDSEVIEATDEQPIAIESAGDPAGALIAGGLAAARAIAAICQERQ